MPATAAQTPPKPDVRPRCGLLAGLLAYAIVTWWLFGGEPISGSWREADTQAMAHNLVHDGFDLLHPRVDWRGASDGRVEAEFPLYQGLVGAALLWLGDVEWPGRLLSLLSLLATTGALFLLAERRCGSWPAALGAGAFLSGHQAILLGTRVIPDGLSTALAMGGLLLFVGFLRTDRTRLLLLATTATTLGLLCKPTAVVIAMVQVGLVLGHPQRRRRRAVWSAFAAMAIVIATWMLHARANGLATGLTFGVTFGDTKMPDLDHLLSPGLHLALARTTFVYGLGWAGTLAGVLLLLRRRVEATDLVVLAAVAAGLLVSLRYSHSEHMGAHYHVCAALAGGWLVARSLPASPRPLLLLVATTALVGQAGISMLGELRWRQRTHQATDLTTAVTLRELSAPNDLVVIRGPKVRFDQDWQRPNNFEEPVLFYQSRRKGFVLPADGVDPDALSRARASGGRWFVETAADTEPANRQWLERHTEEFPNRGRARLFRVRPE